MYAIGKIQCRDFRSIRNGKFWMFLLIMDLGLKSLD